MFQDNILSEKCHEFANYLLENRENYEAGLLSGTLGEVIFLSYYSKHFKNQKVLDSTKERIYSAFNKIQTQTVSPELSVGLCGLTWTLEHLVQNDFLDYNLKELHEDTDTYLNNSMIYYAKNGYFDYLHGALGIANYFLDRNTLETNEYIIQFIKILNQNAIADSNLKVQGFKSLLTNTGNPFMVYNFSLSHGMASIIYFLQKCLLVEELKKGTNLIQLFDELQAFFHLNQNDLNTNSSYFPTWISGKRINREARMAWCYGDIGIGITFLNSGVTLNNPTMINYATDILFNTLDRKDPIEEMVLDAGICHGSSGLSLIYLEAYLKTKRNEFLNASDYWIKVAIEQSNHPDGICGYKAYKGENKWENEPGLLEGISGIGLSFLCHINPSLGNWKKCLMIS